MQYSKLYRLIARASTHLIGTPLVGDYQILFKRLGPIESSNGRTAVLTMQVSEKGRVFCDFVASTGRSRALPQLAVWDFWRGFARACGIFLRESISKVAAGLDPNLLLL